MAADLTLLDFGAAGQQAWATAEILGHRATTSIRYQDVDFDRLARRIGRDQVRRLAFHIAAFEINRLVSLRPDDLDWGPGAEYVTEDFAELWRTVLQRVWAQWRYENDDPVYAGPAFATVAGSGTAMPASGEVPLVFCGGGKDSLLSAHLAGRMGPFASLAYSHSVYGAAAPQHALIDGLLDHTAVGDRRRQWVYDDFLDSSILDFVPSSRSRTLTAAETPSSVFAALPVALARGHNALVVAHERSADTGNLVWAATGEDVNHQWGKSLEAERLLSDYVQSHLVTGLAYFSLLKPLRDPHIFHALNDVAGAVPATHSCNVRKPWCERCPKCAYVWLNYHAYLPAEVTGRVFSGQNLFDVPELALTWRQMVGLEDHTPFECIGEVGESVLAFHLCQARGLTGRALDEFVATGIPVPDLDEVLSMDPGHGAMPEWARAVTDEQFPAWAAGTRRFVESVLP